MNILSAALTTLSASPATGLLLAGELAAAAWMVERFARQTIKIRKQNQALAYERTFSRALSRLDHEVYLLLRRSDTFPLYVAGDLPGLTGLTLEDMQRDIACFFQLMSAADAKTLRRMLEKWDRSPPLRMSFHSKREDRWLELCVLPAEDDRYTLLNLRDVSALRQQREEMAAQLEEAQAASQSKTEFLSRMSHEIRTPINGITGLMALTRTRLGGSNPAAEEYLTRAEDLSQHLLSVINDILDLSRIEAGKIELEQKSFDLYVLADQLRSMFQKTVEAKGLPMDEVTTGKALCMLTCLPNGVQAMSMDIPGLVQTSLNIGILKCGDDEMMAVCSVRSSVASQKQMVRDRLRCLTEQLGGRVDVIGDYPAWEYLPDSPLRERMIEVYREQYGKEPVVETVHAGLECGLLGEKLPGLDCVSFGPDLTDIHTPRERMHIASVQRTWKLLCEVLKRSK